MMTDEADICITDLSAGDTKTIAKTRGWALQVGAHQQWGPEGHRIYFNDISGGRVVCQEFDFDSGSRRELNGPMYQISPDGKNVLGPSLERINFAQRGYGTPFTIPNYRLAADDERSDGLWKTDIGSGKSERLVSTYDLCKAVGLESDRQDTWTILFHTKFNRAGDRVLQVIRRMRWDSGPKWERFILTLKPDGTDVRLALSPESWNVPGHHPHWHPDGKHITMNLSDAEGRMRFCKFRFDGGDFTFLHDGIPGGGHPSYNDDATLLLTDAYVEEPISLKNDEVPVRLVAGPPDFERTIGYFPVMPKFEGNPPAREASASEGMPKEIDTITAKDLTRLVNRQSAIDVYRVDPHPVWSRDYRMVCFNSAPEGSRTVFIADVSEIVSENIQLNAKGGKN